MAWSQSCQSPAQSTAKGPGVPMFWMMMSELTNWDDLKWLNVNQPCLWKEKRIKMSCRSLGNCVKAFSRYLRCVVLDFLGSFIFTSLKLFFSLLSVYLFACFSFGKKKKKIPSLILASRLKFIQNLSFFLFMCGVREGICFHYAVPSPLPPQKRNSLLLSL